MPATNIIGNAQCATVVLGLHLLATTSLAAAAIATVSLTLSLASRVGALDLIRGLALLIMRPLLLALLIPFSMVANPFDATECEEGNLGKLIGCYILIIGAAFSVGLVAMLIGLGFGRVVPHEELVSYLGGPFFAVILLILTVLIVPKLLGPLTKVTADVAKYVGDPKYREDLQSNFDAKVASQEKVSG